MRPTRLRHLFMLVASSVLFVAACSLMGSDPEPLVPGRDAVFPHAIHLGEDVGFSCVDCHVDAEEEEYAGMPALDLCLVCHDAELEGDKPIERTPAGFILAGDEEPTWTSVTSYGIDVNFSHKTHYEAGVDCTSCHAGLDESDEVERDLFVDMASCVRCHDDMGADEGGCLACHPGIDQTTIPADHGPSWELLHADAWRTGRESLSGQDCQICHGPDSPVQSCDACHRAYPPNDHTPFFRLRGHGPQALFDRARCLACHQEDSCLVCHLSLPPLSHTAGFGEPRNRHCLGCHLSGGGLQGCAVCHLEGAPSHDMAPTPDPAVPAHATATTCMNCHTTVRPPRHPVAGDGAYCRVCHN